MAVNRVAVKADFRVQNFEVAIVRYDQRVDFQHLHILLDEGFIELTHQLNALLHLRAGQAEGECDAAAVVGLVAGRWIDRERQDLFRGCRGNLFDVHAALSRANERHAGCLTIHEQREVKFTLDAGARFDIDAVHLLARWAGLMRDQRTAEHLLGFFCGFFHRFGQTNAAFLASIGFFERAFAASTCVDLSLNDPKRPVQFTGCSLGIFCLQNCTTFGNWGAVRAKQSLRLILMDVHEAVPC